MIIQKPRKKKSAGSYGAYVRISKGVGLKILDGFVVNHPENITILKAAHEFVAMKMLQKSGATPKAFNLAWVKCRKGVQIGIVMEHIEGKELAKYDHYRNEVNQMKKKYKNVWREKYGIDLYDWHEYNIIKKSDKKNIRIDFSSAWFNVEKNKWPYFNKKVKSEIKKLMKTFPKKA